MVKQVKKIIILFITISIINSFQFNNLNAQKDDVLNEDIQNEDARNKKAQDYYKTDFGEFGLQFSLKYLIAVEEYDNYGAILHFNYFRHFNIFSAGLEIGVSFTDYEYQVNILPGTKRSYNQNINYWAALIHIGGRVYPLGKRKSINPLVGFFGGFTRVAPYLHTHDTIFFGKERSNFSSWYIIGEGGIQTRLLGSRVAAIFLFRYHLSLVDHEAAVRKINFFGVNNEKVRKFDGSSIQLLIGISFFH